MRPSFTQRVRTHLAALMVGLLVLVSIDPCAAFVAPSHPVAHAPADPCDAHYGNIVCACAQLACQHAAVLGSDAAARIPTPSQAQFIQAVATAFGRNEPPPLPPPRLL